MTWSISKITHSLKNTEEHFLWRSGFSILQTFSRKRKMGLKLLLLAIVFQLATFHSPGVEASKCCFPTTTDLGQMGGLCEDLTRATPFCGRGSCNFFGCNCEGGCRVPRGFRGPSVIGGCDLGKIFAEIDQDRDNVISDIEGRVYQDNYNLYDPDVYNIQFGLIDVNRDRRINFQEFSIAPSVNLQILYPQVYQFTGQILRN